ncbi:NB-ARC domain-containing protein [Phytohabitans houttuyneae]|uniref:NB-ARC domain-containing protein n=1 Tax=Phytohabitans houttuyneae TaxID=1076126 RepID=A0A6V8KFN9_9ACTN|nr:NB-ARC domain-containing protein [Phytohabitans houttuyneae]GFJ80869.1 hypothetical protein Phou_050490 [Phytohabitans houttuyneae]
MRRRRRARPVLIGVLAAAGVFAGLATGLSLPSGGPHPIQLTLAVAASLLSGWLTAVQIGGGSDERPAAPDRPVASSPLSQLPPDLGDFADREAYLATLLERLESRSDDRIAIATVAGKAGVGKTALAIRVAHQVARRFPGGQLYVNLRGVEEQAVTPEDALAGFLRDLGVPGPVIPEDLQERARMYRARLAGRRVLVVLDNAADEVQIRPLVPSSPGSAVLVTSRRPLAGLEGAQPLVLDVMDHQAAHTLFSSVVGAQRVAADPEAASRIVDLCGGLPLAVRIAGARLATKPHWTLSGFVRRLSDEGERLAELRAGDLEVRASFALSYHDLEPRQHLAFQALGLSNAPDFAPWTLAALLDCTAREAADLLEGLADAQLVEAGATTSLGIASTTCSASSRGNGCARKCRRPIRPRRCAGSSRRTSHAPRRAPPSCATTSGRPRSTSHWAGSTPSGPASSPPSSRRRPRASTRRPGGWPRP